MNWRLLELGTAEWGVDEGRNVCHLDGIDGVLGRGQVVLPVEPHEALAVEDKGDEGAPHPYQLLESHQEELADVLPHVAVGPLCVGKGVWG